MQAVPEQGELELCVKMCGGTWVGSQQDASPALEVQADATCRPSAVSPSQLLV